MKRDTELTETGRQYAAAYAAHYTERYLPSALQLYRDVLAAHPGDPEAGYSRTRSVGRGVVSRGALVSCSRLDCSKRRA